ncbi:MAG: hypothetical protein LBR40_05750 [Bacilli bacterium]|jgi:magnesium transporter|nr:hypothetical protein [Bacilli bacterium]
MKAFIYENNKIIEKKSGNILFCDNEEFQNLIKEHSLKYYQNKENRLGYIRIINNSIIGNLSSKLIINNKNLKFFINDTKIYFNLNDNEDINMINKIIISHLNTMNHHFDSIYNVIYFIIDEILEQYYLKNNEIEKKLQTIESSILTNKNIKNNNYLTYQIYHQSSDIKFHLTSITAIIKKLELVDNNTTYLKYLEATAEHLDNDTKIILDQIIQLKELFQNQLDISLNNSMNIFSIIATIFLPLTLITGWYGMNFDMPEYKLKFGYLIPIILSIIFLIITIYLIRHYQNKNKNN